uniref:Uncharacterized protein n=1 Tax=Setaria viridis TaxID=4556 RepID=A0A4U6UB82_SETVI|nr:hypothetical protein SEVIR_6G188050v2 [Setaria viridis]
MFAVRRSQTEDYFSCRQMIFWHMFRITTTMLLGFLILFSNITDRVYLNFLLMGPLSSKAWLACLLSLFWLFLLDL